MIIKTIIHVFKVTILLENLLENKVVEINQNTPPGTDELQDPLFCPYITTCKHVLLRSLTVGTNENEEQCCRPCEFDQQPDHMQCCNDIMPCANATLDHNEQPLVCIRANVRREKVSSKPLPGFMAIASCKPGSDKNKQAMCLQKYNMSTADVYDVLPVSDINDHRVFRNIHCALCNEVSMGNTKYWLLHVNCDFTSSVDITRPSTLLKAVSEIEGCDAYFSNPFPETAMTRCSYVIDRCHVTGHDLDLVYDPRLVSICLNSQGNKLVELFSMILDNSCVECNGLVRQGESGNNFFFEGQSSLSVILALDSRTNLGVYDANTCEPGMIYHKGKRVCIEAKCSLLRRLQGDECEKVLHNVDNWTYRLGFRLKPATSRINIKTGFAAASQIIDKLKNYLELVFGTLPRILFEIVLVSDMEYEEDRNATDVFEDILFWYEVRFLIHIVGSHDPEDKLHSFLAKMRYINVTITSNERIVDFDVFVRDDLVYFNENRTAPDRGDTCFHTMTEATICTPIREGQGALFKAHFPTNYTAVPFLGLKFVEEGDTFYNVHIETERNILEFRECPFVKVSKKDTVWIEIENGIKFLDTGLSLNSFDFVFGKTAEEIWICLDKYDSLLTSGSIFHSCRMFVANVLIVIALTV